MHNMRHFLPILAIYHQFAVFQKTGNMRQFIAYPYRAALFRLRRSDRYHF
jgi:hypothetical protein